MNKCRVCNEYTHAEWCSAGIPDPRAQAEQRLAEKMLHRFHSASPVPLTWHQVAAKLAAEEIAKVVTDRDCLWVTALDAAGIECDPPNNLGWHLVCADAEKGEKP